MKLEITDKSSSSDNEFIIAQLKKNNLQFADADKLALSIYARDDQNKLLGGLIGFSHWGVMHIDFLWVDESSRELKLGSKLLNAACDQAVARNCSTITLETMEFQAKEFYQKQGFEIFGIIDGGGEALRCYYLKKAL